MKLFYTIALLCLAQGLVRAQCVTPISTFPYFEDFETSAAWTSGGTVGNDWAWGSPAKTFINSAGGGQKCWVTGGLTPASYSNGERSWVQSPCFDFSNLQYPHIKFKIYWECENQFDGAVFQYSLNGGTTWTNLGAYNDPVDCLNQNWFNQSNITNLTTLASPRHGWAGSVTPTSGNCQGGGGSGGWVIAQHCMTNLAGQPQVIFRMAFGAGTTCNAYDGIAFDDVEIDNAPPVTANFSYACTNTALQYAFTNTSLPCAPVLSWNFGDPASGASNTSAFNNPTHIFSSPGVYTVTLISGNACTGYDTTSQVITTLNASATNTAACFGQNNASIQVTTSSGASPFSFTLNPTAQVNNTGIFNGLSAGNYTININDLNGCVMLLPVTISALQQLTFSNVNVISPLCNNGSNGLINGFVTGNVGALNFVLNPGNISATTFSFNNLSAGVYTLSVVDAGTNCSNTNTYTLNNPPLLSFTNVALNNVDCNGNASGSVLSNASGGTTPLSYHLAPVNTTNASGSFTGLLAGAYTVTVSDANNCTASTAISISEAAPLLISNITTASPDCLAGNNGSITVTSIGGNGQTLYTIGSGNQSNGNFSGLSAGVYTVSVSDKNGCTSSSLVNLASSNAPVWLASNITEPQCYGFNTGTISVQAAGSSSLTYTLNPGNVISTDGNYPSLLAGTYSIAVSDQNGCKNETVVVITQPDSLQILILELVSPSCTAGQSILYLGASGGSGNYQYAMTPNNQQQSNGVFENLNAGTYTVAVTDIRGCTASRAINIQGENCCDHLFVPNAFSPNSDFKNDNFTFKTATNIILLDMQIYNRYGQMVYQSKNANEAWDGTFNRSLCEVGTYYYFIKYICVGNSKEYVIKGDIQLIR